MNENRLSVVLRRCFVVLVGAWLLVPTLIVVPLSFSDEQSFAFPPRGWSLRYYERFFFEESWRDALVTSLQLAAIVTCTATLLGTAAAFALARSHVRGARIVNSLLIAPIIVPGIVLAIAIYAAFLQWGLVGTARGFIIAHTVLALPFVTINVAASLSTFDRQLERAAASLGASPPATFRRVTLPLILPGVLSGAVFAFVTSFDEVVVSLFLQSPQLQTLPVRMFTSVTSEVDPTIAAASTVIVVITTALIALPLLVKRSRPDA